VGDGGGVVGRALWLGGVIPVNLLASKAKQQAHEHQSDKER
jgi:putative copper export protein